MAKLTTFGLFRRKLPDTSQPTRRSIRYAGHTIRPATGSGITGLPGKRRTYRNATATDTNCSACHGLFLLAAGKLLPVTAITRRNGYPGQCRPVAVAVQCHLPGHACGCSTVGWASSRWSRERLIPGIYLFFICTLVLFYFTLRFDNSHWSARAFYVWIRVYNLFVVSVFWSLMADIFNQHQGKRLFGIIASGGSLGAIAGPGMAAFGA